MTDFPDLRLLDVLVSQLCHDLVSPLGAVLNGLELMAEMTGGDREDATALVEDSAGLLGARIGFFRVAYGAGGANAGLPAAEAAARAYLRGSRASLDWRPAPGWAGPGRPRALLALLAAVVDCLPRGGNVSVDGTAIRGRGEGRVEAGALGRDISAEAIDARSVLAVLAVMRLREAGLAFRVESGDGSIVVHVDLP
ncbi:MAG: histidine phosphotransferase family protein [Thalassobaculales bacterium]